MDIKSLELPENIARAILLSIKGRKDKYWSVGISRKENEKYGISEWQMRKFIKKCVSVGIIEKTGEKKIGRFNCNIYSVSSIIDTITGYISDMNKKIIDWCKESNARDVLVNFGNKIKWYRLNGRKSLTFHKKTGIVSDWKEWKKMNLFDFVREWLWMNAYSFALYVWIR